MKAGREGDDTGWDGWMASLTRRTWVWANSGRWWRTGKRGVLESMGSQRVRPNWVTYLNWLLLQGHLCRYCYAIVFPLHQGFCRDISMLPEDRVCICSQLMPNSSRLLWVLKSIEYRDDFSSGSKNNTLKQSLRRPFSLYNNHGQLRYLVCKSTKYLIFIKKLWYIGRMGSTVLLSDLKEC